MGCLKLTYSQEKTTPFLEVWKNPNTQNFDVSWYDYGARFYDAALGRFTGVDPISDKFPHVSTYNYAENSPVACIDLWGLQAVYVNYDIRSVLSGAKYGGTFGGSIGVIIDSDLNAVAALTLNGGIAGGFAPLTTTPMVSFYPTADSYKDLIGEGLNLGAFLTANPIPRLKDFAYEGNMSFTDHGPIGGFTTPFLQDLGFGKGGAVYFEGSYTMQLSEAKNLGDLFIILKKLGLSDEQVQELYKLAIKKLNDEENNNAKTYSKDNLFSKEEYYKTTRTRNDNTSVDSGDKSYGYIGSFQESMDIVRAWGTEDDE